MGPGSEAEPLLYKGRKKNLRKQVSIPGARGAIKIDWGQKEKRSCSTGRIYDKSTSIALKFLLVNFGFRLKTSRKFHFLVLFPYFIVRVNQREQAQSMNFTLSKCLSMTKQKKVLYRPSNPCQRSPSQPVGHQPSLSPFRRRGPGRLLLQRKSKGSSYHGEAA